jgi:hypothetical protein
MTTPSGFGTGDGAGHYEDEPVGLVWLYSSYFFCGAIAACLTNRKARIGAALVAHSLPFLGLLFASSDQARVLCGIALGTFAVFGVAWLHMLVESKGLLDNL